MMYIIQFKLNEKEFNMVSEPCLCIHVLNYIQYIYVSNTFKNIYIFIYINPKTGSLDPVTSPNRTKASKSMYYETTFPHPVNPA